VVHLRYPGVSSIIEGRAGAAKVDFPVPKENVGEGRGRGSGATAAAAGEGDSRAHENLYAECEGVVYIRRRDGGSI